MKRLLMTAIAATVLYLVQAAAWAGSPGPPPDWLKIYESSAAVFVGTVTSIRSAIANTTFADASRFEAGQLQVVALNVDEALKGVTMPQVAVATNAPGASCFVRFKVGEQYLVFAQAVQLGASLEPSNAPGEPALTAPILATDACSGSGAAARHQGTLAMLRNVARGTPRLQIDGVATMLAKEFKGSRGWEYRPMRDIAVIAAGAGQRFQTRTDAVGSYLFENLPEGRYTIHFEYPAPYFAKPHSTYIGSSQQRAQVDEYLDATGAVRG